MIKKFLFLTLSQRISAWNFESIKGNPSFGNILNNLNGQSSSFNEIGDKSKQLSDMNILLPLQACEDCRKAYKKVVAYNGCYKWKISHPKQIKLDEYSNSDRPDCSNLAELSVIDLREQQTIFYLTATDQSSTSILKTVVKVAKISSIELKSKFSQINRGDKLHLEVRAKDSNGNTFSTLDGMRFEWHILKGNENIRRIPWKESDQLKTKRIFLEEGLGEQGDDFLLTALQPGNTTISVKILEKGYENVQESIFHLTIVDPFVIRPDDNYLEDFEAQQVYLLPTSDFKLKLSYLKKNQEDDQLSFEDVKPADLKQYDWNLMFGNRSLSKNILSGQIANSGLFKSKITPGIIDLQVDDLLFKNNKAFETLNVVEPKRVYLQVKDISQQYSEKKTNESGVGANSFQNQYGIKDFHDSWVFVEDRVYLFKTFLVDENNNKITLTKNVQFDHLFNKTYFKILHENPNHSELVVKTLPLQTADKKAVKTVVEQRLSKINSTSAGILYQFNQEYLNFQQEVLITAPVKIFHPENFILLPLNQNALQERSTWLLKAGGGSGVYIWESKETYIADIENQIKLRPVQLGQTELTLRDFRNPENYANIIVEVAKLANLVWLEKKIELESKKQIRTLSLIGKDSKGRDFSNCSALQIEYDLFGDGLLKLDQVSNWNQISSYLKEPENQPLLQLFSAFKLEKSTIYADQLKNSSFGHLDQFVFNNLGICSQVTVSTIGQAGLNRVKGRIMQDGELIESSFSEIAAYQQLQVDQPNYTQFFEKFTSLSQEGQEFLSFNDYSAKDNKFVIAFGSKLKISFSGGSNYWLEQSPQYQTKWQSESQKNSKGLELKVNLQKQNYTSSMLEFWCYSDTTFSEKEKTFKLTVNQKARQNNDLLQPDSHQIEIQVSCIIPNKMRILWSQKQNETEVAKIKELLPRSRVEAGQRISFVMVDSQYDASTLYFNEKEEAALAQQSLVTSYSLSNKTIAEISKTSQSNVKMIFGKQKGFVELTATTSSFDIQSLSSNIDNWKKIAKKGGSFFNKDPEVPQVPLKLFSKNELFQDKLIVNVVENVEILPNKKTIYLRGTSNPFEFIIKEGSGYFNVNLNDSSLAEKEVIGRKIKVFPLKEGPLSITVTDIELPNSTPSTAILIISDIKELRLDTPLTLLEQYQQLNLTVTAWDYQGVQFDSDQNSLMQIEIQTEMTGIHQATDLIVTKVEDKPGKFIIQGQEQGNYQVNAFVNLYKSSSRATSKAISIEVFPMLRLEPASLLLTPYMRYSVQVFGGPNKVESNNKISLQLEIENRTVATINSINEITGNQVGNTSLTCKISYTSTVDGKETTVLVSRRSVQIRVRLVTKIAINSQTEVYKGSLSKYKVELKYFDETFTQGVVPASFNWNTSDNQVLKLYLSNTQDQFETQRQNQDQIEKYGHQQQIMIRDNIKKAPKKEFNTQFNSSTIFLKAKKAGQSTISIELAISYPSEYDRAQNWFQTQASVFVYDRIKVPVSEYSESDQSTHLYLLPRNAINTITTNVNARLKMGYSMQSVFVNTTQKYEYMQSSNPIISIIEDRKIKTLDKYGKVTLIMEEYQSFGDQVAMLNILITDIKSVTAINYYDQLALPLGSETHVPIKYLNEHGHLFANNIEGVQIGFNLSHPKVASASLDAFNQSLTINAISSGECVVMVYLISDHQIYDVFKIRVATMIQPSSPVHLHQGATVQFKMVEKNDFNLNKSLSISKSTDAFNWKAQNSSVIKVDAKTGGATALQDGKTLVTYENGVKAESQVYVSKVSIVEISQGLLTFNVDEAEEISRIRLSVFLESNPEQEVMPVLYFEGHQIVEQNIKIKCESSIPDIVQAIAEVNKLEGYFCKLSVKNQKRDSSFYKRLQTKKPEIFIYIQTGDAKEKTIQQIEIGKFQIQLYGNLNIESQYRKGVTLYQNQKKKSIRVTSLSDFDIVETDYNGQLKVQKIKEDSDSFVTSVIVQVLDSNSEKFQHKISLRNKANGEITQITINFDPIQRSVKTQQTSEKKEDNLYVSKQSTQKSDFQFYLVLFVALVILFFVLADEERLNSLKDIFCCCFRGNSDGGDLSRSYYSARNQVGQISQRPNTFMKNNPYLDQSSRQVYPAQQYGRGSVVSPRAVQNSNQGVYRRAFADKNSSSLY